MPSRSVLLTVPLMCAAALAVAVPLQAWSAAEKPPYVVKDGIKLDKPTYKGFLYYGDSCLRCHGPDAMGSSYAPNLTESLKTMTQEQFQNTVINGRKNLINGNDKVMPAFGQSEDVVNNLDQIYGYIKARSDGALRRGHPEHLEE